jgi:hypothetical protein
MHVLHGVSKGTVDEFGVSKSKYVENARPISTRSTLCTETAGPATQMFADFELPRQALAWHTAFCPISCLLYVITLIANKTPDYRIDDPGFLKSLRTIDGALGAI